jgi:hypothetical protein
LIVSRCGRLVRTVYLLDEREGIEMDSVLDRLLCLMGFMGFDMYECTIYTIV